MKRFTIADIQSSTELQEEIKYMVQKEAEKLGFALSKVAEVKSINTIENLQNWVQWGYHADMHWFSKNLDIRTEILKWFSSAKSVIVFAYPYGHICENTIIAKYAHGYDYHKVITKKIHNIAQNLSGIIEDFHYKISVDSNPVHEKTWAVRAGIGWQGKNSLIINPHIGSWFLLGILATNIYLPPDKEVKNQCGECNICINACPTKAINEKGYYIDSRKCLSYHTIENKSEIPLEIKRKMTSTIYGCDICQAVCPWNKKLTLSESTEKCLIGKINIEEIIKMDEEEFARYLGKTPIKKSGINRIKRNAEIYLKNKE